MNYEEMWKELKKWINALRDTYEKGYMCSIAESINKEGLCIDILEEMEKMEISNQKDTNYYE